MGHNQDVDAATAKRLNALERQLSEQAALVAKAQAKYDALFVQVWDIFDRQQPEPGQAARFLCEDGFVLGRIVPRVTPTVDARKLIALVEQEMPGLKGKRLLSRVVEYEPRINQLQLAEEVVKQRISERIVKQCVTQKAPVPRRHRREASAHYKQALAAGIIESPADDEEEWTA